MLPVLDTARFIDAVVADAAARPDLGVRPALVDGDRLVTHAELAELVRARAAELALPTRSLVVLTGDRSVEPIVTYLALLDAGHVPLLVGDHAAELATAWDATAVATATRDGCSVEHRDAEPIELHPDLALLLGTSGSTGSPKLVRLSQDNLLSNARSIAEYLELGPDDRGITTLPLHYCYGLSILHSHLLVGASVVLTEASVVDPCFRDALTSHAVTNVAGVPHTFELLERVGPERLHVPSLRFVTQAGGRLAPDAVRRWAARTAGWGASFYVMYGQTEATARMAYLPPELADRRPEAIGVPIPGGELSLHPVDELPVQTASAANTPDDGDVVDDVGELVYRGPNVMLGYATDRADLARGRDISELRTGDLARYHADDGVFEIVGRRSRFVKPFGVRIDLEQLERFLRDAAVVDEVAVAGDDRQLAVVAPGADAERARAAIADRTALPVGMIVVDTEGDVPRTTSGKVDYDAVQRRLSPAAEPRAARSDGDGDRGARGGSVAATFAAVLGRDHVAPDDTFVSLGGDSLSYVECSIRLEQMLGTVPTDWHLMPVGELAALAGSQRHRRIARLDTTVLLRTIGICVVVATHMGFWYWPGGAHLLLAVVGFNLARFMMPIEATGERVRAGLRTVGRVAIPTVVWTAVGLAATGAAYGVGTLFLVNNYVGPAGHSGDEWHFWFIEVFVHVTLAATLLLAIPAVRRSERRFPYLFPLALLGAALVLRMEWAWLDDWYNFRFRTHSIAWFFVLGWLIQRSTTRWQRLFTTALCLTLIPGFFDYPPREWFIACSLVVLIWAREIPFPRLVTRPVAIVASASMWILISHFTFWPPFEDWFALPIAYVLTIAAGVVVWAAAEWLIPHLGHLVRLAAARRRPSPTSEGLVAA